MSHPRVERDADGAITVTDRDDIYYANRDITSRVADIGLELLNQERFLGDRDAVVVWVPEDLAAEKSFTYADRSDQLATGQIIARTDAALCLHQAHHADDTGEWLPRSPVEVFRRGRVEDLQRPQAGLADFDTGGDQA